jgi:intracellular sulfur oxidation DsrE/DsrF family protein
MTEPSSHLPRRSFLGGAAAAALGLAVAPSLGSVVHGQGGARASASNPDAWLEALTGKHRTIVDMPEFHDNLPPVHILNYLNTYNTAYNVPDSDINVVGTFYGATTLLAANDAMWAKYQLGELLNEHRPDGSHWTGNPWRTEVNALGMTLAPASLEALQRRGVLFIACNNALNFFTGTIAQARGLNAAAVDTDVRANLLPGVVVVPAMVIAIEKAQAHGLAYRRE